MARIQHQYLSNKEEQQHYLSNRQHIHKSNSNNNYNRKKDSNHHQQQLPQLSTIAATEASKIEQTKPTTMIISSNPSYTTSANNSTQISIQSTPTTLITTTSNINKTPAKCVHETLLYEGTHFLHITSV